MKHVLLFGSFVILIGLFSSCIENATPIRKKIVTVYTDFIGENDSAIYRKFEKETGIEVRLRWIEKDSILTILKKEKYNSRADLLIFQSADFLIQAEKDHLFQVVDKEEINKNISNKYQSNSKNWFALGRNPLIIAYKKSQVFADSIRYYADLARPKWNQQVMASSSPGSGYRSLSMSIRKFKNKEADTILARINRNTHFKKESQSALIEAFYLSQSTLLFTDLASMTFWQQKKKENAKNVGIIIPNQRKKGVFFNITGAGVYRYARHSENAIQLLTFLTSKRAQYQWNAGRNHYPINEVIEPNYWLKQVGTVRGRFYLND